MRNTSAVFSLVLSPVKSFSIVCFVALLTRALEVGVIAALALRWFDLLPLVWDRIPLPASAVEVASDFSLFAIVLLLVADLWLLLTRQPRAVPAGVRTLVYLVVFILSPYRLGSADRKVAQWPSQATMELTGARVRLRFTVAASPEAQLVLVRPMRLHVVPALLLVVVCAACTEEDGAVQTLHGTCAASELAVPATWTVVGTNASVVAARGDCM